METKVIMKRELFKKEIRQESKLNFFCANDLVSAGNKYRAENNLPFFMLNKFMNQPNTKEFIASLANEFGEVVKTTRGRNGLTWVHPYLFIDIALAINPDLKIHVYSWIFDNLIKLRNNSGDSYKKMAGALYLTCSNKSSFPKEIVGVANIIKNTCSVTDWQNATEEQLILRDKIHNNISLLADVIPRREAMINLAIQKAKKEN